MKLGGFLPEAAHVPFEIVLQFAALGAGDERAPTGGGEVQDRSSPIFGVANRDRITQISELDAVPVTTTARTLTPFG